MRFAWRIARLLRVQATVVGVGDLSFQPFKLFEAKRQRTSPSFGFSFDPYHADHVKQNAVTQLYENTCLLVMHTCLFPRKPDLSLQISMRIRPRINLKRRSNHPNRQKSNHAGLLRSIAILMDIKALVTYLTTNDLPGSRIAMRWQCGPWRTSVKHPLRKFNLECIQYSNPAT